MTLISHAFIPVYIFSKTLNKKTVDKFISKDDYKSNEVCILKGKLIAVKNYTVVIKMMRSYLKYRILMSEKRYLFSGDNRTGKTTFFNFIFSITLIKI